LITDHLAHSAECHVNLRGAIPGIPISHNDRPASGRMSRDICAAQFFFRHLENRR